jgi:hypothetical protein
MPKESPKISASLGLTWQVGDKDSRNFIRPFVEFTDIDVDGNVDAQIKKQKAALVKVWNALTEELEVRITDLINEDIMLQPSFGEILEEFKERLDSLENALSKPQIKGKK